MKKIMLFVLILTSSIAISKAQGSFQLHVGPAFPTGDFADDSYENAIWGGDGCASMGLNLGIKYYSPLKPSGLSLVFGLDFMYNPLSKDFKDDLEDDWDGEDITFPKYINIPFLAGLNYQIPVSEKLAFFGEGSLGFNILKITKIKTEADSYEYSEKFSPSVKFSYTLGGGMWIQDKYSIGLNYYGLGSHKCDSEWEETYSGDSDSGDDEFERSLDISAFTLTFGIKL